MLPGGLFTEVPSIGVLGSSHPALCVAPSLCGAISYVEFERSTPFLHKNLSGAVGRSELRLYGVLGSRVTTLNLTERQGRTTKSA